MCYCMASRFLRNELVTLIYLPTLCRQRLVVGVTKELTMNVNLTNSGEDSYLTSMALSYPGNLLFKRIQKVTLTAVLETCRSRLSPLQTCFSTATF